MKSRSTRSIFCILPLLILPFLFTSCIDYVQSFTYSDGLYHIYTKITVNKAIIAMSEQDPDELFPESNMTVPEGFPPGTMAKRVDTDIDVGFECRIGIDPHTTDEDFQSELPKMAGSKCYFPFIMSQIIGGEDSFTGMDGAESMAMVFLSEAKCRIIIAKNILPEISRAYFEGIDGQPDYEIPVYDYGNDWCAEIPFIILYNAENIKTDRMVVIKA